MAVDLDNVTLQVTSQVSGQTGEISGWTKTRIVRAIDRVPNSFTVNFTSIFQPDYSQQKMGFITQPFDPCILKIGPDTILTGYIDVHTTRLDSKTHELTISGRGKTCDLVDSSASYKGGLIGGVNSFAVAEILAKPFGIKVVTNLSNLGPSIPQLPFNYDETPWDIIERNSRYAQQIAYEQADGSLILTQVGKTVHSTTLTLSADDKRGNIEKIEFTLDGSQRFSQYRSYLINTAALKDVGGGATGLQSTQNDSGVPRFRLKSWVAETQGGMLSVNLAVQTAIWELNHRLGKSQMARIRTDSWRDSNGVLWQPNYLIHIDADAVGLNTEKEGKPWVIGSVTYERDESGTHADLVCMPQAAYLPQPGLVLFVRPDVPAVAAAPPTPQAPSTGAASPPLLNAGN